jgi:hypothetical protein
MIQSVQRWTPPARWRYAVGQYHVSSSPDCRVELPGLQRVQDAQVSPVGPSMPSEPETPVPDLAALAAIRSEVEALQVRLEQARDGIGSGGLALSTQLKRLRQRHNVHASPLPLPLGPPCEAKALRIRGYAATPDVDADRSRFLPTCWPALDASRIKLLVSHDFDREVGHLDSIEVDALGRVVVVATVTDVFAMGLPALSISASIERFTIHNPDRSGFVGEIERVSEVNEISLTTTPSNRNCLVFERWIPSPVDLSYEAMIAQAKRMQKLALQLRAA